MVKLAAAAKSLQSCPILCDPIDLRQVLSLWRLSWLWCFKFKILMSKALMLFEYLKSCIMIKRLVYHIKLAAVTGVLEKMSQCEIVAHSSGQQCDQLISYWQKSSNGSSHLHYFFFHVLILNLQVHLKAYLARVSILSVSSFSTSGVINLETFPPI